MGKVVDVVWGLIGLFPVAFVVFGLAAVQCATGCTPSQLEDVADKVPVQFTCGVNSDEALEALLIRYISDPKTVTNELKEGFEADPSATICLLIDGERYLQRVGKRQTEAYTKVIDALKELKVIP